jgi:hypothetical protein
MKQQMSSEMQKQTLKQSYQTPELTELGSVEQLTKVAPNPGGSSLPVL